MRVYAIILICVFLVVGTEPAFAYIDPTSGSYFFQFLLAAILGGLVAIKLFWRRIKAGVGRLFGRGGEADDPDVE